MGLSMETVRLDGGSVDVLLVGEVDLNNAHGIRDCVTALLAGVTPAGIRIDLRRVTLLDSVGIGTLVSCFHAAAACGVPLTVINPNTVVHRSLWVSGLIGLFGSPAPLPNRSRVAP